MEPGHRLVLRIVPTDSIRPHEIADPARERRIKNRLVADGLLRDPLVVGAIQDLDGYVLLDGTNRKRALAEMGLPWVMAQIIDYADEHAVALRTWCHQAAMAPREILTVAGDIPGTTVAELPPLAAADALRQSGTLAVVLDRHEQYAITRSSDSHASRADQLIRLVGAYEDRMVRVDCGAEDAEERAQSLDGSAPRALVAFPGFSRSQVVTMAMRSTLIPAGITRHVIQAGRALRVNLPLSVLSMPLPEEANAALREHLHTLSPRRYREPTILFDS